MHWLDPVNSIVEEKAAEIQPALLARSAERLSTFYREGQLGRRSLESDPLFPLAYAITRLPATAAAIEFVFEKIRERAPELLISSLLDLGAGPATALLPFLVHWPSAQRATLIEFHPRTAALGSAITASLAQSYPCAAEWKRDRLPLKENPDPHDLVLMSYVLNELNEAEATTTLDQAWTSARELLVIIEPGTPAGFESLLRARRHLIAIGANVLAPCPGECACPLQATSGRWCHFSVRLPRTRRHRLAKGGELGWEDEKFSYCVFTRTPPESRPSCIISRPIALKPGIELPLCTPEGLEKKLIRRSDESRPRARRAKWGDFW